MKVLVTGGAAFICLNLVEVLLNNLGKYDGAQGSDSKPPLCY